MGNAWRCILTAVAIMAIVGSTAACRAPTPGAEPDCASQLRFRGSTYTADRLTEQPHTRSDSRLPCARARS